MSELTLERIAELARENEQLLAEQTRLVDVLYSIWVNGTMDNASIHAVAYALERHGKTTEEIEAYEMPRNTT